MKRIDNEAELLNALGRIIGQNANWLSGRDFQRLALRAAQAHFPSNDLDDLCRPQDFTAALAWELSGTAGDPVEM